MPQPQLKERINIKSKSPKKDSYTDNNQNKAKGPIVKILTKDAEDQMREYLIQNDPGKSKS